MTDDVEMEAGRETHVGFESECFLLLAPAAHNPLHRERARKQANGEMGILKPTRGKMKRGREPGAASLPSQIGDAACSKACRLLPLQLIGRPPTIVVVNPEIPQHVDHTSNEH